MPVGRVAGKRCLVCILKGSQGIIEALNFNYFEVNEIKDQCIAMFMPWNEAFD